MSPEADQLGRQLTSLLASPNNIKWLDRAIVLNECGSTQDEAFAAAAGKPGLLLTAIRQTRGRGRLGRAWVQKSHLGLAATFVLDADAHDVAILPLRVACAICHACEALPAFQPKPDLVAPPCIRIKWPNDVVVAGSPFRNAPIRKLAGVLIERRDSLLLVGIGINLLQQSEDWPENLRGHAVSLAMLGAGTSHEMILGRLIESLDRFLFAVRQEIETDFRRRDVLTGTRQTFEHDRKRYEGVVALIDPIDGIKLKRDDETVVTLPAMTTMLVPVAR